MTARRVDRFVHVGYELGTGEPIEIPIRHMAVVGQTQESGKTTTLEALIARPELPDYQLTALAFVTKRGERSFASARRVAPYFRDRADWQFVTSLIDATLQERNKFLRPWIMKICRTTKTLADVQRAVRKALEKAKGINEGVYTQLDAYLDLIVPEIARVPLTPGLELRPGLNVMDLTMFSGPMQMLFLQSALDWVNAHAHETIVIVPEAWEFVPEKQNSPVKASAIDLVRKGAGIGNYIWVDSQDMAGVDKTILRGCVVWLIGVQREANEIKRNLSNIPQGIKRPTPADIARLQRGQFYVCWTDRTVKVYVQPAWMDPDDARAIARGDRPPFTSDEAAPLQELRSWHGGFSVRAPLPGDDDLESVSDSRRARRSPTQEITVTEAEAQRLRDDNDRLQARVEQLEQQLQAHQPTNADGNHRRHEPIPVTQVDTEGLYQAFLKRLAAEAPKLLRVAIARPAIEVEVTREVIHVDGKSTRGRIARLVHEGFFSAKARTSAEVLEELARRGEKPSNIELGNELKALVEMGFFTRDNKWLNLVDGMQVNVVERSR